MTRSAMPAAPPADRAATVVAIPMAVGRAWLMLLGGLLVGYAFLNRSFAHLGVPPLYVGELVLLAGLATAAVGGTTVSVHRCFVAMALLLFMGWGAATTLPYLSVHGLYALRDAVAWGYGVFSLLLAGTLLRTGWLPRVTGWYGAWMPWLLVWATPGFLLYSAFGDRLPLVPGTDDPILVVKGGDLAVHLAAALGFLYLGLAGGRRLALPQTVLWVLWGLAFVAVGSQSRGGLLAMLVALGVLLAFRPSARVLKLVAAGSLVLLAVLLAGAAFDPGTTASAGGGEGRGYSPAQIVENIASVFAPSEAGIHLSGTVSFRLAWWGEIVDYTLNGPYFWTGKGYGINLADSDGFQVLADGSLRSPHNAHLCILARSGVPGLLLWLLLLGTVTGTLVAGHLRNRTRGRPHLADLYLWVLAVWAAALVNMSFDVYLEGPQGGIWVWCLVGFTIALREAERETERDAARQARASRMSVSRST